MSDAVMPDLHANRTETIGRDLSRWMRTTMASLSAEIRSYPTPIPRCDAQFNHLMAQRDQLARLIADLDTALEGGDAAKVRSAVERFAALPPIGESADERGLRARIARGLEGA